MTRVKICGITRVEDALAAAQAGADAIGLVFHEQSPRHVTVQQAARVVAAVPPFVTVVGLFVNPSEEKVREVMRHAPLDVLQFHGEEEPEFCARFGRPWIKAIRVRRDIDLIQCAAQYRMAQGMLLDAFVEGAHGGTGVALDWAMIPQTVPLPVILAGGLHTGNVAEAIRLVRPHAVDVSSGVEAEKGTNTLKGIKDAAKIAAFINEVKRIDLQLSR